MNCTQISHDILWLYYTTGIVHSQSWVGIVFGNEKKKKSTHKGQRYSIYEENWKSSTAVPRKL